MDIRSRVWVACLVALSLGVALAARSANESFEKGRGRLDGERPSSGPSAAASSLVVRAEAGDVAAQTALGVLYAKGMGDTDRDPARARLWFGRAAKGGDGTAAYWLGVMTKNGEGALPNAEEAARWLALSAELGSAQGMFLLANAYRNGSGVPQDVKKAVALYEQAAALEHPAALQELAFAHRAGAIGLAKDPLEAHRYETLAAHALTHAAE